MAVAPRGSSDNDLTVAKWLRNPVLVGITVTGTIAGAFRIALSIKVCPISKERLLKAGL
jgi:hypothetical protein